MKTLTITAAVALTTDASMLRDLAKKTTTQEAKRIHEEVIAHEQEIEDIELDFEDMLAEAFKIEY